jgi:hypothetical protein
MIMSGNSDIYFGVSFCIMKIFKIVFLTCLEQSFFNIVCLVPCLHFFFSFAHHDLAGPFSYFFELEITFGSLDM